LFSRLAREPAEHDVGMRRGIAIAEHAVDLAAANFESADRVGHRGIQEPQK
jgi:hypothetical protein